jgi:Endosomal/lysosomal potassium channel TMEM175
MTRISSRYADSVTDAAEPDRQDDEVGERPNSELVAERLSTAEVEDDMAEAQREMEFAAVERLIFFTDAVVAIALTLLALELPIPGGTQNVDSISIPEMLRDARQHIDDYIAFLISFVVIAACLQVWISRPCPPPREGGHPIHRPTHLVIRAAAGRAPHQHVVPRRCRNRLRTKQYQRSRDRDS